MSYFTWLKDELKSLNAVGAVMLAFIIGVQVALFVTQPINTLSVVTLFATIVGSACTVYMMIGRPVNGLLGLISAIGFIYINWTAGHYASVLDQMVFIALIDVPLMLTWKTWGHRIENGVKFLTQTQWAIVAVALLAAWWPMTVIYTRLGDTNPVWDSIVLLIGGMASWLVYKGYGDSYTLWVLSNVVTVMLWATALFEGYSASALPMLLTIIFYMSTALYGKFFSIWSKR